MLAALILGLRVKLRRTQYEYMFSALPPSSDIARRSRHFAFVPGAASTPRARESLLNTAYATQLARLFGLRLRYGLRRRERRHRLARRGGSRPWR